jgi:putative DNA primase/helicase
MTPEAIRHAVAERVVDITAVRLNQEPEYRSSNPFIRECFKANELGDGILFAHLHAGQFIFNKATGEWCRWSGHYWERDIMNDAMAAVDVVAKAYRDEALVITNKIAELSDGSGDNSERIDALKKLQGKYFSRINRLRTVAGCKSCLKFAHTNSVNRLAISGDELDAKPWLLACRNGVVDLRTGELRDGLPNDWLFKACPHEFEGIDTPAPNWERALLEIFSNHFHVVEYLQRLLGYGQFPGHRQSGQTEQLAS